MSSTSASRSAIDLTATETPYQGKDFCFTINNPNARCKPYSELANKLEAMLGTPAGQGVQFVVWCREEGKSGTNHLQGFFQLKKKMRESTLHVKLAPFKMHMEAAKGTAQDSIHYVHHTGKHADKPGLLEGPWNYGSPIHRQQGQRTDIAAMVEAIKDGASVKTLCRDHTSSMLKYFSNASKIAQILSEKSRKWKTELYIYTGRAGAGKSYQAREEGRQYLKDNNLDEEIYDMPVPSKNSPAWFQGYEGQSVVIINDFYGTIDINMMKNMADEHQMLVPVKNGHAQFLARRIYITSNVGWKNWWGSDILAANNHMEAMQRRITVEKHFTDTYEERLNEARQVTMLNDRPINQHIDDELELACLEDFDEIMRGNRNAPLSPIQEEVHHNQEADPAMQAWAENAMRNWSDYIGD